ncbi:hypothetical protein JZO70_16810 [Enterococcus sp. 669A]|uniref:Alternate signal-mediated exported protein n=1 Tax=Candidatus Enterococcus moelleringii TaxID=2815325 RepID=A0ABS3LDX1_9ENTE|nr:BsaA family SipW-dependent biofilm matrix protein [Enterococcus sp. 669A]MBO1307838.1 hypothetical protein [Enterococcus sp. 669A]
MNKGKKLLYVFYRSKISFALLSLLLSLLLVIGSTYAWYTDSDERINRMVGAEDKLAAEIKEDFNQVSGWAPGTTREKKVRVTNTGKTPAIVRLSFTEAFVGFEVDKTDNHRDNAALVNGNGNLKLHEFDEQTEKLIDVKDLSTWQIGNVYSTGDNTHYIANAREPEQSYEYNGNRAILLEAFKLNFKTAKVFDKPADTTGQTDYWYYEDGYFYYSEILEPNESTIDLLESVTLTPKYANQYEGALYKLVPQMDAHDITKVLIHDWSIETTSHVYTMYQDKLVK